MRVPVSYIVINSKSMLNVYVNVRVFVCLREHARARVCVRVSVTLYIQCVHLCVGICV